MHKNDARELIEAEKSVRLPVTLQEIYQQQKPVEPTLIDIDETSFSELNDSLLTSELEKGTLENQYETKTIIIIEDDDNKEENVQVFEKIETAEETIVTNVDQTQITSIIQLKNTHTTTNTTSDIHQLDAAVEKNDQTSIFPNTSVERVTSDERCSFYPNILVLIDEPYLPKIATITAETAIQQSIVLNEDDEIELIVSPTKRKRQKRIFNFEGNRLASLRPRKVEESTPAIQSKTLHEATKLKQTKEKKKKEEKQQLEVVKITAEDCRSPDFLNRIEALEYNEPKPKRKRGNTTTTRKRSGKVANLAPVIIDKAGKKSPTIITNTTTTSSLENSDQKYKRHAYSESEDSDDSVSPNKRSRNMSLYERRYQTAAADDRRGVVSNGYINNSTRIASANSANVVHADAADAHEIQSNQQYYISSATTSSAPSSTSGSNSGMSSTNGAASGALYQASSMATLCNIGNTCYLNSVVYTLRFAPHFLHNLHHLIHDLSSIQMCIVRQRAAKSSSLGRGVSSAQLENARSWSSKDLASLEQYNGSSTSSATVGAVNSSVIGGKSSHQALSEKLHDLYQSLHRNELCDPMEPYHADMLLHAIQEVSTIFEGNQQQDAHELLMCVLNSIRETSQTLIKAIVECPDMIANGQITGADESDSNIANDKDAQQASLNSNLVNSAVVVGNTTTSSTLSSLSTKPSFFSRKSKRKDEAKTTKSSRLQSPLKDSSNTSNSGVSPQSQQTSSQSLFYLNTVDLSGASSQLAQSNSQPQQLTSTTVATTSDNVDAKSIIVKDKARIFEKIRELGLDFFSEDFEGVTVATTKCLSCETITEQKESMIDIAVPVPISGYDSSDYTDKPSSFIQNSCITREYFRGENKYRCEQCTGYTEAIRSISYEVLPRLLIIQLSRFSGGMEKINSYIPTSFTLQCFCAKCCELSDANKLHIYKLYSVITHVGATMSVGHYIAYTCALDWSADYINCPKDRRTATPPQQSQQPQTTGVESQQNNGGSSSSVTTSTASALASSGTSLIKKMKFGRSKASSSGDMSKNMKQLNGLTSKSITNGIGKLTMNTTCHSINCCAMRLCNGQHVVTGGSNSTGLNSDFSEESLQNGSNSNISYNNNNNNNNNNSNSGNSNNFPAGYGSTGRAGIKTNYAAATSGNVSSTTVPTATTSEPIWYMCDDDKIKAMTQREFEELLSPTRKITITPYLLFYARFDLQTPQTSTGATATTTTATNQPTQSTSSSTLWSNENQQSGAGGVGNNVIGGIHKV